MQAHIWMLKKQMYLVSRCQKHLEIECGLVPCVALLCRGGAIECDMLVAGGSVFAQALGLLRWAPRGLIDIGANKRYQKS